MSNALGKYLKARRGELSLREFSKKCQISHTHLDSIEKGEDPRSGKPVSISTDTLHLIAEGIGEDFVVLACLADNINPLNAANANFSRYHSFVMQHPDLNQFENEGTDFDFGKMQLDLFGNETISSEDRDLLELFEKASPEKKAAIRELLK